MAGRRGEREAQLRAALEPLSPHERPATLTVASALSALVALAVLIGALSVHDLGSRGGSIAGGALLAGIFGALSYGMYRHRYWAVLGFEGVLAFQVIVTSLALVVASTLLAAALCLVTIVLGGWLFWKLIRVMGRIQAAERLGRPPSP